MESDVIALKYMRNSCQSQGGLHESRSILYYQYTLLFLRYFIGYIDNILRYSILEGMGL